MFSYRFFLLEQLSTSIMEVPTHSLNARWNKTKPNTHNSLHRKSKVNNSSLYVVSHRNIMYIIEFWVLQKIMFTFYVPVSIWVGTRVPWLQRASQEQTLGVTAHLFSLFEKRIFFSVWTQLVHELLEILLFQSHNSHFRCLQYCIQLVCEFWEPELRY